MLDSQRSGRIPLATAGKAGTPTFLERRRWLPALAALTALAVAVVLRFAALPQQPGLFPDEAAEAWDAHLLLTQAGFHPVFFADDAGREALYGYLVAAAFKLFGESVFILRGVSAALGVLGAVGTGLALRRFGRGAALVGMAWSASALWLVCMARDGERNVLVPLFAALALAALAAWGARPGRIRALLAGAAVAAGLWTYQPLKLTPLLVVLWLAWLRRADPERYRGLRSGLAAFVLAYLVVAAPMLWTALTDPVLYFGRAAVTSPLNPSFGFRGFGTHVLRTLGMFAFTGDPNPRHNVDSLPLLNLPLAALALLGGWRAWRNRAGSAHSLLLLGIPVFLLPPLLAVEGGSPHFLRSLALAPFLAGLIGLGALEIHERATAQRSLVVVGTAALLAVTAGLSGVAYFSRPPAALYEPYSGNLVQLAAAARQEPGAAVVSNEYEAVDVRFLDLQQEPTVLAPGVALADPGQYGEIVALSPEALAGVAGEEAARDAVPIAWRPDGQPSVWAIRPGTCVQSCVRKG